MKLFEGKRGVILGVANEYSIASAVAEALHAQGAELAFSHLPDKEGRDRMEKRVRRVADPLNPKLIKACDVTSDDDIKSFFGAVKEVFGRIDFVVHSIAFAPLEDIRCATIDASRAGFHIAMDVSAYSLVAVARAARDIMNEKGSIVTMSYFGAEKVVGGYNLMGVAKATLEACVRYLAYDLGPKQVRVNGISAGPIKTLAASAVGDFSDMLKLNAAVAPMGRNITTEEVAQSALFLLSDMSSATTGEVMHVDCGYNIMGSPGHAVERLGLLQPK